MVIVSAVPAKLWRFASIAAAALLVIAGALSAATHGAARVGWIAGAVLLTLVQQVAQAKRESSAEQIAVDTRFRTNLLLTDAINPLIFAAARMIEAGDDGDRREQRGRLVEAVVNAAVKVIGPEQGVRACFFFLDWDQNGAPGQLRHERSVGRADVPRSPFEAGTDAGDEAIRCVLADEAKFCLDVDASPPPGWDGHTHTYRTFLSVPVIGANQVVGMLTVDAIKPGDLVQERDEPILRVFSRILALSYVEPAEPD